ncbi:hypothetical protein SAY87_022976 [Trapa incisa]|uniref:eRF1/Pelota-like N-terminal domain-containing protein n=1 Tax=Trapa incisa TaxID=236973 RepID=A0AAN7QA37_9MYRT|nr:hypothetical protein SAY87_022976 [Trapa incisa]
MCVRDMVLFICIIVGHYLSGLLIWTSFWILQFVNSHFVYLHNKFVLFLLQIADGQESDKNIEIWKIKKLIKALESARGNGTSMISLIMPPGDESGTASNIKSTVNGQSVLGAIRSTQRRIKLYNKVPPSGLVLYTRTIITADGKEKKVTIDFEPFMPINASLYLCYNKCPTRSYTRYHTDIVTITNLFAGRLPYCQTPFPSSVSGRERMPPYEPEPFHPGTPRHHHHPPSCFFSRVEADEMQLLTLERIADLRCTRTPVLLFLPPLTEDI